MGYIRAEDVLPSEVLALVQKYVDGQMLYVPKKDYHRNRWGSLSGARSSLKCRNDKIYDEYKAGRDVKDLAGKYFLSVKSIQKIIRDQKPSEESDQKEKQEG
ncbi:MAG: hypothetical protein K2O06_03275 [Acetatifactor sp.]|nr:hypothetical protein [Acetatifactor sp.]